MSFQGAIECVQCHSQFERDEEGVIVELNRLVTAVEEKKGAPQPKKAQAPEVGQVGQHLLKGWTMLADHCPRCLSPIMRDPSTHLMWCVECNVQVLHEEDFDPSKHRAVNASEPIHEVVHHIQPPVVQSVPKPADPRATIRDAVSSTVLRSHDEGVDSILYDAKNTLLRTLVEELGIVNDELIRSRGALDRSQRVLQHIRDLTSAIDAVRSLK